VEKGSVKLGKGHSKRREGTARMKKGTASVERAQQAWKWGSKRGKGAAIV